MVIPTFPHLGYRIPDGAEQLDPLPWTNLDTISLAFSEDVVVAADDLTLWGVNVEEYDLDGFSYNEETFTVTWTLPELLGVDKLLIGLGGVEDLAGNPLDGDGAGDPNFLFRFDVLPGDVDRNGVVDISDALSFRPRLFASAGDDQYHPLWDLDGSGIIDISDALAMRPRLFSELPEDEPSLPAVEEVSGVSAMVASSEEQVAVQFTAGSDIDAAPITKTATWEVSSTEEPVVSMAGTARALAEVAQGHASSRAGVDSARSGLAHAAVSRAGNNGRRRGEAAFASRTTSRERFDGLPRAASLRSSLRRVPEILPAAGLTGPLLGERAFGEYRGALPDSFSPGSAVPGFGEAVLDAAGDEAVFGGSMWRQAIDRVMEEGDLGLEELAPEESGLHV